jgi:hypothetical protein
MQQLQNQLHGNSMSATLAHQDANGGGQFKGSFNRGGAQSVRDRNSSGNRQFTGAQNRAHEEAQSRSKQLSNIEANMMQLNIEKDKLKDELNKLPLNPKKGAQIRRRETLEQETQILTRQIGTLKCKLRELQAI